MRASKVTLQKLGPAAVSAEQAVSVMQPGPKEEEEDDNGCIICLDQPSSVTFHPCRHSVTCSACAQLVMAARQPCPLCRGHVSHIVTSLEERQ